MLKIGIPKETKRMEGRVSLVPSAVAELVRQHGVVYVQQGAGLLSGFDDKSYQQAGAHVVDNAKLLYEQAELIVKVKEPTADDLRFLRKDHSLFCYLHLAANRPLLDELLKIGLLALAFETVQEQGLLPLLAPMSEIAGRVAVQSGAHWLHGSLGGRGVLLGGTGTTGRGQVTVLGAGTAGTYAALEAASMGANVTVFDLNPEALRRVRQSGANITGLYSTPQEIEALLPLTDLLIGAVLVPGMAAPKLVTRAMVRKMPPGSVIVDIAIDQGGCIETMRPTDYQNPTFIEEGVIHIGVTNLPGAVPRTASQALSTAILPYVLRLAKGQLEHSPSLKGGINVNQGQIVHPALVSLG